jgi:molybdopterin/thiamine biosynthesis adenylyltransferase
MEYEEDERFDRQKRVQGWNQEAISSSRCLVAGAGALGNEVVKLLLQLGVGEIAIVDFDVVEKSNLNRCVFFREGDAEKKTLKARALAREARKVNGGTRVKPLVKKIEELSPRAYNKFDFAFGCLDNLGARLHLNANSYGKIPLIDGGTTGFMGKVQVVKAPSSCVECGLSKSDYNLLWKRYNCVGEPVDWVNPAMPALPTTTSVIAALQVKEFIKLVHANENSLVGRYLFYDGVRSSTKVFDVARRKGCPVHGD